MTSSEVSKLKQGNGKSLAVGGISHALDQLRRSLAEKDLSFAERN